MPSSVRLFFKPLEPALIRGRDFWALRLGVTEMDEDEFNREWISNLVSPVLFREPVDDGNDVPDVTINRIAVGDVRNTGPLM